MFGVWETNVSQEKMLLCGVLQEGEERRWVMRDNFGVFFLGCAVGVVVGVLFFVPCADSMWRTEAVKRGYAEYSQTTGEWQWKTQAEKGGE